MTSSRRPSRRPGPPRSRAGFSLIELLINVAIISALVGIAAPFYHGYIYSAQSSKAGVDIETLSHAIRRFESRDGMFAGGSLQPLVGTHLRELSADPWGNEYFVDGSLGVIGSFGADGILFGEDEEGDITNQYNPYLIPIRAFYYGPFGIPKAENRLVVKTKKVFGLVPGLESVAANDLVLIRSPQEVPIPLGQLGFEFDPDQTDPARGIFALRCCASPNPNVAGATPHGLPVRAHDEVDFAGFVMSVTEISVIDGPLWEAPEEFILGPRPAGQPGSGMRLERSL